MLESFLLGATLTLGQAAPAPVVVEPTTPAAIAPAQSYYLPGNYSPREEAEAANDTPTYLFMSLVDGTSVGDFMAKQRLSLSGWVAQSYTASSANDSNLPVTWNDRANRYLMQQAWLRFERAIDPEADDITFGFRMDMLYGTDYRFSRARNIWENQTGEYGFDPIAFYVNAYLPGLLGGTEIKFGRWFTPFGVESLEAVSTPLVSRSYSFNWAPPFTHTGALATMNLGEGLTAQAGLAVGNDIFFGPGQQLRFIGTLSYTPNEGDDTFTFGTSFGEGSYNAAEAVNNINVFDFVWAHKFNDKASYSFETIYGYQNDSPLPRGTTETAHWLGIANYLFYQWTDSIQGVARLEFFDDFQGYRTGYEGLYTAITGGFNIKPVPGLIIRPELRYDYNSESRPFEGERDLFTAAIDVILRW
ncbi:outer membrane beta-barrel protein [Tuwongella immobilis]|uniref:Porin n=1 Tax=Tuwongella immobilis TaxID=692036 RepID=A0A6C2YJ44_9BACT|nr:outer membrane beta-barrel protein [Tuwongella immobilis]VIP01570.1 Uncharacterized protein OS=Nitrosococcus watsoni (strain C-113) GN=Nwat_1810 PE=4 SV=1: DUF1597 [Tuwongella immobilis]VTR98801.1 Uncharacterized protein OS=Nitrosococcus watsoni (strain C-113) GN=Nwat_1810 PE=4 SV=1: DUF1597 [Tuwongella immobilis]